MKKSKLKNNEDISDAIQNTMLIMFKNIKKLRKNEYFGDQISTCGVILHL